MTKFLVCQQNKVETIKNPHILQPLSIPIQRWKEVSMDFITSLPKFEGNIVIIVVVDRFIKYATYVHYLTPSKQERSSIILWRQYKKYIVLQIL